MWIELGGNTRFPNILCLHVSNVVYLLLQCLQCVENCVCRITNYSLYSKNFFGFIKYFPANQKSKLQSLHSNRDAIINSLCSQMQVV